MKFTRRHLLAGAGALTAASPFLPMLEADAADGIPPRLLVFSVPHFSLKYGWAPQGGETDFTLAEIMEPLQEHRDRLLIVTGLEDTAAMGTDEDVGLAMLHGHVVSSFGVYTGRQTTPGPNRGSPTGPSFDQIIAEQIGQDTPYKSLQFGVNSENFSICAADVASILPMESDPAKQFDRLFGRFDPDAGGPSPEALRRAEQRKSVLDFVSTNLSDVSTRVGAQDRQRIEAHMESIQELERSLELPGATSACTPPEPIGEVDYASNSAWNTAGPLQMELAVASLACDMTRVATIQWGHHGGNVLFDWLGLPEDWHYYAHRAGGTNPSDNTAAFITGARWLAERFNDLLASLAAVDVGDGSLLDHTLVAWVAPPGHGTGEVGYLLAGGERLGLQTGRNLHFAGGRSNEMMLSLIHRMGLTDVESFGDPGHCDGPLIGV